jgi:two-component system, OmpR family, sensor histidine kinase KdpD
MALERVAGEEASGRVADLQAHARARLHTYFLANISHEFRTPLAGLSASVELLLEELDYLSHEEIRELLKSLHMSVTGLQTLIDNLLESSSIEAGHFRIRRRPADFHMVVEESVQTMAPLLERRRQRVLVAEPAAYPPLELDPVRVAQVLVNLLSNASKYSPVGTDVALQVTVEGAGLRVTVADRGPGLSAAERETLFQRWVRRGEDNTQYGVGLGLLVVKAIVDGHGGEVGVLPRPGGGSRFWFTLPGAGEAG